MKSVPSLYELFVWCSHAAQSVFGRLDSGLGWLSITDLEVGRSQEYEEEEEESLNCIQQWLLETFAMYKECIYEFMVTIGQ